MTGKELKPSPPTDERVKAIAHDVGTDLVDYMERMYPEMVAACRSWKSAKISLRNHVYNDIMAAVRAADEGRDEKAIKDRQKHRRALKRIRSAKTVDDLVKAMRDK